MNVASEGTADLGGRSQPYQILDVQVLEGDFKGASVQVNYGKDQIQPAGMYFQAGDQILITVGQGQNG